MNLSQITKKIENGIRDLTEAAVEARQSVMEFSETPLGIAMSPAFPLLVQNPAVSIAERLFRDPGTQSLVKQGARDIREIYLATERWTTLGTPLPTLLPPIMSPAYSILIGASKFLQACEDNSVAQKEIHYAVYTAKSLAPKTMGERLLEQELQGLEMLSKSEE